LIGSVNRATQEFQENPACCLGPDALQGVDADQDGGKDSEFKRRMVQECDWLGRGPRIRKGQADEQRA